MQIGAHEGTFNLPGRRLVRRRGFMLTPLIDVLFLLLIFFMLTSQVTPFAMIPLSVRSDAAAPAEAIPHAETGSASHLLVRLERGVVIVGDERLALPAASEALERQASAGIGAVSVLIGRDATVQDTVSLLELLQAGLFAEVQVVAGRGQ